MNLSSENISAIKITPDEIFEIKNYHEDPDYKNHQNGYALAVPECWKYKKYELALLCRPSKKYNLLASIIYNNYKTLADKLFGTFFIVNEHDSKLVDFTKEDLTYLIRHIDKFDRKKMNEDVEKWFGKMIQNLE